MANIELRFLDDLFPIIYSTVDIIEHPRNEEKQVIRVRITDMNESLDAWIHLDESTAIKFAKTIRTAIAKIKE